MLGSSVIQAVALVPSMPQKARWLTGAPFVAWKPLASAQVLGSRARSADATRAAGTGSFTVTKTCPETGALQVKVAAQNWPGKSGREVVRVPRRVPPAAGSPR